MSTLNFNELNSTFRKLIGDENASLYRFQEEVAAQLLTGDKNLILRAPTGSGKTWAALLPYLYARKYNLLFVDKVLYALPLRSLASQLYQSTANACKKVAAELDTITVKIQTGEQQDDPFFQGDIVFTTIDQLLSSYLLSPVSLPRRLANINAGALLGSLVVFDEFHLLDPDRSMGTAIEMLELSLIHISRVLIFIRLRYGLAPIKPAGLRKSYGIPPRNWRSSRTAPQS